MAARLARMVASRVVCISSNGGTPHGSPAHVEFTLRHQCLHPCGVAANSFSSRANATAGLGDETTTSNRNAEVKVTQSRSSDDTPTMTMMGKPVGRSVLVHTNDDTMELVDQLLSRTYEMMDPNAANVVAYSGGVDSSLVAALVHRVFSDYQTTYQQSAHTINGHFNNKGSVQAVLGISPAVPQAQITVARTVADKIGIQLTEVSTTEGSDDTYQRNDGYACYVCKTHLYSTLRTVANAVMKQQQKSLNWKRQYPQNHSFILYNGTNADDTQDPTRLGLIAASNFRVHSPLDQITKNQVRQAAKYLGLPNWNAAASPCLRSRLAMGVTATEDHLKAVELAEEFVRRVLRLDETVNARVRMLSGGKAMVELDDSIFVEPCDTGGENWAASVLREHGFEERCIDDWGFNSFGGVRGFKTGSVAAMPKEDDSSRQLASSTLL